MLLQRPRQNGLVEPFVREVPTSFGFRLDPQVDHHPFQAAESLFFRNAGVRDSVHATIQQVLFFLRREVAVVGHACVVRVRHEVHDVLFQVGAGARNRVNLVLANHFRQAFPKLGRAHRSSERDHHLATCRQVCFVAFGCVFHDRRVEVVVVARHEGAQKSC